MTKPVVLVVALVLLFGVGIAGAAEVMPDFSGVPTGWVTDRYEPHSFSNVGTFEGRNNVLGIEINEAEGFTSRPGGYQSTFYNTQGRQYALSGGAGSTLSADLWIPATWGDAATNGNVRTDMWGVMTNGTAVTGYPIIGFTNYGGAPRYRAWDADIAGGWVDLSTLVAYDAWTAFSIAFTGITHEYFINNTLVYTDTTTGGSTGFQATIMQAYNFFGDPALSGANPVNYTAHWSNTQAVPEPSIVLFLVLGLAGVVGAGSKFHKR